ncbi:hypothetical protein BDZ91DRAFT_653315 [Kalaharituber pfeilii]|nr:hypothetical protein BDZ91DRAFT_653315 [Kalaharituber pfeilii]
MSTTASIKPSTTSGDDEEEERDEQDEDEDDEDGIPVQGTDDLPTPFDTNMGKVFTTTTCPAFFNLFLNDPVFKNCLPLSAMLQQNSKSFFEIMKKSGFATTRVLDAACSVDYPLCAAKMEYYGREIKTPERCGTEFASKNQLVIQAYAAFISYPSLYKASCLKSDSGSYCYVDAVTNVSSPDDSHIYYIPLGVKLPGGSRPTCSSCLQETMDIFREYAGNKSLPLSETYVPAANQMNIACGPEYVNTSVQYVVTGAATHKNFPHTAKVFIVTLFLSVALFV